MFNNCVLFLLASVLVEVKLQKSVITFCSPENCEEMAEKQCEWGWHRISKDGFICGNGPEGTCGRFGGLCGPGLTCSCGECTNCTTRKSDGQLRCYINLYCYDEHWKYDVHRNILRNVDSY